jgi:5,10-methylenetetrahydromethanopterin reductase
MINAPLFNGPSGLAWLPQDLPKVPLDVAASGPKVIAMAASIAERVTFSVGAIPERIDWALGIARAARARAGLTDTGISYGAQVIVICHPDQETALKFAAMAIPGLARFQVIQGQPAGSMSASDSQNFADLRRDFDMAKRGGVAATNNPIGASLTPEFVQRFAIVGPPDVCVERLLQLVRSGIERFVVVGPGYFPEAGGAGRSLFATEVMPAVRAAARA